MTYAFMPISRMASRWLAFIGNKDSGRPMRFIKIAFCFASTAASLPVAQVASVKIAATISLTEEFSRTASETGGKIFPDILVVDSPTDFLQFKRSWPFWTVLFPNGGNALKNISPRPPRQVKKPRRKKLLQVAADAERKKPGTDSARRKESAKEWKNRLGKIKSGDLKAAQSCREISEALAADEANGLLPGISASNEIRALRARLLDYDQDTLIQAR